MWMKRLSFHVGSISLRLLISIFRALVGRDYVCSLLDHKLSIAYRRVSISTIPSLVKFKNKRKDVMFKKFWKLGQEETTIYPSMHGHGWYWQLNCPIHKLYTPYFNFYVTAVIANSIHVSFYFPRLSFSWYLSALKFFFFFFFFLHFYNS